MYCSSSVIQMQKTDGNGGEIQNQGDADTDSCLGCDNGKEGVVGCTGYGLCEWGGYSRVE